MFIDFMHNIAIRWFINVKSSKLLPNVIPNPPTQNFFGVEWGPYIWYIWNDWKNSINSRIQIAILSPIFLWNKSSRWEIVLYRCFYSHKNTWKCSIIRSESNRRRKLVRFEVNRHRNKQKSPVLKTLINMTVVQRPLEKVNSQLTAFWGPRKLLTKVLGFFRNFFPKFFRFKIVLRKIM